MGIFSKEECKISNPEDEAVFTFKMHSNPELLLQQLSIIICLDQNLLIRFYDLYSLIWITLNNNIWNNSNAKKSILLKILTISNLLTVLGNKHFPTANEKHPNIFFFLNRTNYIFLAGIGEKCVNMFNILYLYIIYIYILFLPSSELYGGFELFLTILKKLDIYSKFTLAIAQKNVLVL